MTLRTLDDLGDVAGKRVFVRVDFNVPLDGGAVADDARIRAALPTVTELLDDGASLVLASHLGRPKGQVKDELRLAPVAGRLQELLGRQVVALGEPAPASLPDDPVILLENLRFDPGEEANDPTFAGRLAELADAYVDDAFGAAHRAHASVSALPELMRASGRPSVAGISWCIRAPGVGRALRDLLARGRLWDARSRRSQALSGKWWSIVSRQTATGRRYSASRSHESSAVCRRPSSAE